MIKWGSVVEKIHFFITNPLIAIDIDDRHFRLAEILYKERYILKKIKFKYKTFYKFFSS